MTDRTPAPRYLSQAEAVAALATPGGFVVLAHRGAGSLFGAACAPVKGDDGEPLRFDTRAAAQGHARRLNEQTRSPNVYYSASEA